MTISSLKELERLIKLCRKNGVRAITVDGITMSITEPSKRSNKPVTEFEAFPEENIPVPRYTPTEEATDTDKIETDTLTDEQLLMWSAQSSNEIEAQ